MKILYFNIILLTINSSTFSDVFTVPIDYPTITSALNSVNDGDTILIESGTYHESIFVDKSNITIRGEVNDEGNPLVTIDGENQLDILIGVGVVGSSGCTIENIEFTRSLGNAIWIYHHSPTIRNCTFVDNSTQWQGGAIWSSDSQALIDRCLFLDNGGSSKGSVVFVKSIGGDAGPGVIFHDCLFEGNEGSSVASVQFYESAFQYCTFKNNYSNSVITSYSAIATIYQSVFCENNGDAVSGNWDDAGGNNFYDICPDGCLGDIDNNMEVGVSDLLATIESWGYCEIPETCTADLDSDGSVDVSDILILISEWGDCL